MTALGGTKILDSPIIDVATFGVCNLNIRVTGGCYVVIQTITPTRCKPVNFLFGEYLSKVMHHSGSENQHYFSSITLDWLVQIHSGECISISTSQSWRVAQTIE